MKRYRNAFLAGFLLLLSPLFAVAQQPPSFLNLVSVGDSLGAGFSSGVLKEDGQIRAYSALIARQVGTFHFLPLMPDPGVGQEIKLVNGVPTQGPITGGATSRGFPLIVPQNLAIPGQDVIQALTSRPNLTDPSKPFENLILGVPLTALFRQAPVSQIELAVGLKPTFTLFWLGSNDVLKVATSGVEPTPLPVFTAAYQQAAGALLTLTSTKMIVATIPDVTVIAFLTSAEEVAQLAGVPLALIGPALGISSGDYIRPGGAALVEPILTGQVAGPIPESQILRAARVAELRMVTAQMNGFIKGFAAQFNVPVADINAILEEIDANGYELADGRVLTTQFLGGLFSLDGVHPTSTGQGLIANSFIERMNEFWGLQIPLVNIDAIAATDPLIFAATPAEARLSVLGVTGVLLASREFPLLGDDNTGHSRSLDPGLDPGFREEISSQSLEEFLGSFRRIQVQPGPMPLGTERRRTPAERERITPLSPRP